MRGPALLPVLALVSSLAATAHAQQAPLTPLPLPPPPPPPVAAVPPPPPPPPPEPPTFEGSSAPTAVSGTAYPPPPPPPPEYGPPPPIACTGPGTFTHDGFYARFSSGVGFLGAHATGLGQSVGLHGYATGGGAAFGGTPSRGFVVGGLIQGLTASQPSATGLPTNLAQVSTAQLAPFVDWYPDKYRGWHVGGSLGLGLTSVSFTQGATSWVGASVGGGVFGGYDFWIGPEWSIGLQGALSFTTAAKLQEQQSGSSVSTGYTVGSFGGTIGVALVYH